MSNLFSKEFEAAINQICDEKGISRDVVLETVGAALAAAYRKDYGQPNENPKAEFNNKTNNFDLFDVKEVIEDETEEEIDERKQVRLTDAKKVKKDAKVGDEIKTPINPPGDYGRVAAQTAKQVIIQRIREAEREVLYNNFKGKEGELVNGTIQRIEGNLVFVDLGQATGFLPSSEQVPGESYRPNQRLKVYISEVRDSAKGPEVILSRSHPEIIRILFSFEVPEIASGSVEVKAVAREAGSRSKIAVTSHDEDVDPIGACVGQRGARVQAVINEINGEKIDIIEWKKDPAKFITNALAPAKVEKVEINKEVKTSEVFVADDQLSLAIGKEGQNVRLAARLTEWKIDVKPSQKIKKEEKETTSKEKESIKKADGKDIKVEPKELEVETKKEEKKKETGEENTTKGEEKSSKHKKKTTEKKEKEAKK